ncbi:MAG: hypothetical protein NTW33_07115 [Methanoregula sp.]|nr:hypothetical protein [Methanoregula sp.]
MQPLPLCPTRELFNRTAEEVPDLLPHAPSNFLLSSRANLLGNVRDCGAVLF